jgi:hypothetical protein
MDWQALDQAMDALGSPRSRRHGGEKGDAGCLRLAIDASPALLAIHAPEYLLSCQFEAV